MYIPVRQWSAPALALLFTCHGPVQSSASAQGSESPSREEPVVESPRERFVEEEEAVGAGEGAEEEYPNAVAFGFIYVHAWLRSRESSEGEPLEENENLYGFNLAYDRTLIPSHLVLGIAKPFLFNRERYDSPLEVVLKALIRRGNWEPFFALGLSNNFRMFAREREELEGRRFEYAVGLLASGGVTYIMTPHWGIELELVYVYTLNKRSVSHHELSPALNAVYFFERGQRRK